MITTHPPTVSYTVETLEKLDFEVLEHSYSLDLVPFTTHLFEPFKDILRGNRFATNEKVMHKLLHNQPKTFFSNDKQACGPLEEVYRKTRRLCRKIM